MKQNLRNMAKGAKAGKIPSPEEVEELVRNADPNTVQNIQNTVNKYAGKSEAELFSELKKITNSEKQAGNITDESMEKIAKNLETFLDEQQRKRLQDIMRQLKG